jgi:recombination protein RecA
MNYVLSGKYWGNGSGFALGALYNFFGPESSGKSALALQISGDILRSGGRTNWVDAERSFDPIYAKASFGIDIMNKSNFHLVLPDYGEQAFDAIKSYVEAGAVSLVVVDSVSALGTKRTQEADAERNDVASLALRLSQHLQTIIKPAKDMKGSVIYINQLRDNLISMGGAVKAAGKKYTGGSAMKFYPHTALKFVKGDFVKAGDEIIGQKVTITAEKNKLGMPWKSTELILIPGEGFSVELDILMLAVANKVVAQKGNWYYFGEQPVGNGLNQSRLKLKEKPEMLNEIWEKTKYALQPAEVDEETGEIISETPVEEAETPKKKKKQKDS